MEQDNANLKHQYDVLTRTQNETGHARMQELERQVNALTDQRKYLNKEKSDLEEQCLDLRKENSKLESRIFDLRQKNQSQIQSQGDLHSIHAAELESYVNKNRDLSFQLNANKKTIDEVRMYPILSTVLSLFFGYFLIEIIVTAVGNYFESRRRDTQVKVSINLIEMRNSHFGECDEL